MDWSMKLDSELVDLENLEHSDTKVLKLEA